MNHQTAHIIEIIDNRKSLLVREFAHIHNRSLLHEVLTRLGYQKSDDMRRYVYKGGCR